MPFGKGNGQHGRIQSHNTAKLMAEERKKHLLASLDEQRHLLRKSISDIVKGDLAEALRIATILRVLVHESGRSKPLLKQLNPNYLESEILAERQEKPPDAPPGLASVVVMSVPIGFQIRNEGVFLSGDNKLENHVPTPLGVWWNRPCLILPGLGGFSRRFVILGLANKEGGAHVDTDVTERYRQLLASKQLMIGWGEKQHEIAPLNLSRMMAGQAGIEMLDYLDKLFPRE